MNTACFLAFCADIRIEWSRGSWFSESGIGNRQRASDSQSRKLAFVKTIPAHVLTAECLSGDSPQALGWFNAVNADVALMRRAFVTYPGDAESRATETAIDADNRALPQRNWYPYNTCADVRDVCGP